MRVATHRRLEENQAGSTDYPKETARTPLQHGSQDRCSYAMYGIPHGQLQNESPTQLPHISNSPLCSWDQGAVNDELDQLNLLQPLHFTESVQDQSSQKSEMRLIHQLGSTHHLTALNEQKPVPRVQPPESSYQQAHASRVPSMTSQEARPELDFLGKPPTTRHVDQASRTLTRQHSQLHQQVQQPMLSATTKSEFPCDACWQSGRDCVRSTPCDRCLLEGDYCSRGHWKFSANPTYRSICGACRYLGKGHCVGEPCWACRSAPRLCRFTTKVEPCAECRGKSRTCYALSYCDMCLESGKECVYTTCRPCKKERTYCDRGQPCSRCRRPRSKQVCVYDGLAPTSLNPTAQSSTALSSPATSMPNSHGPP